MKETPQIQTQNEYSDIPIYVGIENVRTQVKINDKIHIPMISIQISSLNNRGIHMSRIIESMTESLENSSNDKVTSLEEYSVNVFNSLRKRHQFDYFQLNLSSELVMPEITPVSKKSTLEVHDIFLTLIYSGKSLKKTLSVKVLGGSCCPHGKANNIQGRSHVQRSEIMLSFTSCDLSESPKFEQLIKLCNLSFSSPTYTLLKTPDEQYVIDTLFDHPKFVEDIIRDVIINSKLELPHGLLYVKVINFESIHKHNAVASKTITL